ncbi:hypothetical protein K461DRAFT_300011 [Myriangium duriaei CBS 260.36]|uniref:Glycosyl transferase CAP10 domain-containing protein n=1 Tax=Myriangium duriaei CBS 260.36 TaxID=1168546 RepID=A0A9P4JAV9_9PEZI|nr:hypothetical protein K461DRAFT_300011 [Myriangium duriaei CBS 260.36]
MTAYRASRPRRIRPVCLNRDGSSKHKPLHHPIKKLHEQATKDFETLIQHQSKTLSEAVEEYKRRYGRSPPLGFDKWFKFATKHDSVIIDDFDMITESIEPLWQMTPVALDNSFQSAKNGPSINTLSIRDGKAIVSKDNWMGEYIAQVLEDVLPNISDLQILMNGLDEPRVLLARSAPVGWSDTSLEPSWARVSEPCSRRPNSKIPAAGLQSRVDTYDISFVTDIWQSKDICKNPNFEYQHGFLVAPSTFITTSLPLAVLSQATVSTFSDILYPSMFYYGAAQWKFDDVDVAWENKSNKLYWAGSTTGSFSDSKRDQMFESHRHRFNRLTNGLDHRSHSFLTQSGSKGWKQYESDEVLSQLYDTKFTSAVQCWEDDCGKQYDHYKFSSHENSTKAFSSRFLMDLDGNSFSGRFYNFLKSRSCALKMTIFREWHDERLMPWFHYIPISVGMEELPEAVRFLALTSEGGTIAEEVAMQGRKWHDKMLREEDAAIYLYRLFLEYARVSHKGRDDGDMDMPELKKS